MTVVGDHNALRRAVGNLLSNAVRLAPPGTRITVAAGRSDGWLWTAVRDEGPGILDDDQARVFDRFWRAKGNGGGRDRHAGLGLGNVRQIVESHGGQVRLFSRVGEGSTFVLWSPTPGESTNGGPPENAPVWTRPTSGATPPLWPWWRTCPHIPARTAASPRPSPSR
ncbi:sensor histidine kinase [Streptomyces sp. HC307]|uniref:sensor histidine kinase n=1 Tax=Streptomyces flavusporus TaxID=3385496 RepID=UPI003917442B